MSFLFILRYDPFESASGTQIFAGNLALELARRGHSVKLIFETRDSKTNVERPHILELSGFRLVRIPVVRALHYRHKCANASVEILRRSKVDAVIAFGAGVFPGYTFRKIVAAMKGTQRPTLIYYAIDSMMTMYRRSDPLTKSQNPIDKFLSFVWRAGLIQSDNEGCAACDVILASSNDTSSHLSKDYCVLRSKIKTIYLGVPDDFARGVETVESTVPTFLHIGGGPRKGTAIFLEAMKLLEEKYGLEARAVITRATESQIREVKELGIVAEVHGLTTDADLRSFYSSCTAVVSPSPGEGFCLPVVEAAMFGKPAIVSNGGCLPELVVDGENGFIVPVSNVNALADKMYRISVDRSLREKMGNEARLRSFDFTISRTAKDLLSLLADCKSEINEDDIAD